MGARIFQAPCFKALLESNRPGILDPTHDAEASQGNSSRGSRGFLSLTASGQDPDGGRPATRRVRSSGISLWTWYALAARQSLQKL